MSDLQAVSHSSVIGFALPVASSLRITESQPSLGFKAHVVPTPATGRDNDTYIQEKNLMFLCWTLRLHP